MEEIGPVAAISALDRIAAAVAHATGAADGNVSLGPSSVNTEEPNAVRGVATQPLARDAFAERVLGAAQVRAAELRPHEAGTRADNSNEAARLQTFARPHAPVLEPLPSANTALPAANHSHSEFAVPAAQLVPALLVGLQVEPATSWPCAPHGCNFVVPQQVPRPDAQTRSPTRDNEADDDTSYEDDQAEQGPVDETSQRDACGVIIDNPDCGDWCGALTRALRESLAAKHPPQALLAAAEQWQRGRCVVLACPRGADSGGRAWVFVLWSRSQTHARRQQAVDGAALPLMLFGLRVDARLQWSAMPPAVLWCHVRTVKEHNPRRGRQLVALSGATVSTASAEPVPCEVQLGPLVARLPRWRHVCVHVSAARQVWAALGNQWSVHVLVCSQALIHAHFPRTEATVC